MSERETSTNWVHDLLRKVKLARLEAMITSNLEDRMSVAANILDEVESVLTEHDISLGVL